MKSPVQLGLPPKFKEWRKSQIEGIELFQDSDKSIIVECQPTGSGKSALGPAIQKLGGKKEKLVILTATKNLQTQYMDDFASCGMVDVRGANNYKCESALAKSWESCEDGMDNDCSLSGTILCPRYSAMEKARISPLVVTNYQCWMHTTRATKTAFGQVTTLLCDEAHAAMEEVGRFLTIRISWGDAQAYEPQLIPADRKGGLKLSKWATWAKAAKLQLRKYVHSLDESDKVEKRKMKELQQKLWWIENMTQGEWVWEPDAKGVTFECIWPGRYTRGALFCEVPRILLLSATIRPYTLQLLGIGRKDYDFKEWPRVFPLNRMPFIHVPTIAMTYRTEPEELESMVARADEIIEGRLDRKGLIHTKSYDRAKYLQQHSRYGRYMLLNDRNSTRDKAEQFRKSSAPRILVSPSYPTGWDFPYKQCEYQIIIKVPFENTQSQIAKQRKKEKRYMLYSVMQELVQMRGRGMRAEDDRCETFIIDNLIQWVEPAARRYAPSWWTMRTLLDVPNPPAALR